MKLISWITVCCFLYKLKRNVGPLFSLKSYIIRYSLFKLEMSCFPCEIFVTIIQFTVCVRVNSVCTCVLYGTCVEFVAASVCVSWFNVFCFLWFQFCIICISFLQAATFYKPHLHASSIVVYEQNILLILRENGFEFVHVTEFWC